LDAVRPWLLVGKLAETLDPPLLREYGVGAMLQFCEAVPQPGIVHRFLDVDDGVSLAPAVLDAGVAFVRGQKAEGRTVLVACARGASRSVTFAVAALREEEGLTTLDALREVVAARRVARPHPALWRSLCERYGEEGAASYAQVLKACRPPGWT